MSTFKECTYNTIKNTGELINGRLLYSWLLGGNTSQPVYFGLKDTDNNWNGNLVSKGTSSFYLTSDTNGCTAEVKDSTYTPTTADANTAREIWLNIPKSTASRTIKFSYNGTIVLTVIQNIVEQRKYRYLFFEPTMTNTNISQPIFCIVSQSNGSLKISNTAFTSYASGYGGTYDNNALIAVCLDTDRLPKAQIFINSKKIKQLVDNNSLIYESGNNYLTNTTIYNNYWIIFINDIITELTDNGDIAGSYDNYESCPDKGTYDIYSVVQSIGITKCGEFQLNKSVGMIAKY